MFTIDVANTVFVVCLAVGGILLLVAVLLGDVLGGILDGIGVDFDIGGVSLMPLLLAFVAMFGVGGLIGTEALGLGSGPASLVGAVFGAAGAGIVYALFALLRRAEAPDAFSLRDLVGRNGRVTVGIPANRNGSVLVSHGGATDELTATADTDIPAGTTVTIVDVVAGTLIVRPMRRDTEGSQTDA
ncbi:MAG TPA: NfeD family protein [Candidatus Limnocylindria bacterium]|nr:NfeD family protein [Candidatus Limnocylindria bacterium]